MDSSRLGNRIRRARDARGWSQRQLAERAGLSRSLVSRLEAGKRAPKAVTLMAISAALGLPLRALAEPPLDPETSPVRRALEETYGGHAAPFLDEVVRTLASATPEQAETMLRVLRALREAAPESVATR